MITIEKHDRETWDDVNFVLNARKKEEHWQALHLVYSTGKRLVASDTFRLHTCIITQPKIPKGTYEVINSKDKIALIPSKEIYPNWLKMWPNRFKEDQCRKVWFTYSDKYSLADIYHKVYRSMGNRITINPEFLKPFFNGEIYQMVISIVNPETTPFLVMGLKRKALIMPMMLRD